MSLEISLWILFKVGQVSIEKINRLFTPQNNIINQDENFIFWGFLIKKSTQLYAFSIFFADCYSHINVHYCLVNTTVVGMVLQIGDMNQTSDFFDDSSLDASGGRDEVGVDTVVEWRIEKPDD